MSSVKKRIEALVDKLARDITATLIVRYALRLRPETLQYFRELFEDALGHAKHMGELHAWDRPDDDDPDDLLESTEDTVPGFTRRPPPPKK